MRPLMLCVLVVGCTDAAEVPATVVHVQLSSTCTAPDCNRYAEVFYGFCGPSGATPITPRTREVDVVTSYDANDIAAYVQLQYTSDAMPPGTREPAYLDQVLTPDDHVDVYAAYDYAQLYRITASGEVVDLDTSKLAAAAANVLQFRYSANGISAQEDHVIDPPFPVRLEVDSPAMTDACCSAARPGEAGLAILALAFVLRRRRAHRRHAADAGCARLATRA